MFSNAFQLGPKIIASIINSQQKSYYPLSRWQKRLQIKQARVLRRVDHIFKQFKKHALNWQLFSAYRNEITNLLFWMDAEHDELHMTYEWFAEKFGCCRMTAQRTLDALCQAGILIKQFRFKQSNIYTFKPIVYTPLFRSTFSAWFPALKKTVQRFLKVSVFVLPVNICEGGVSLTINPFIYKAQQDINSYSAGAREEKVLQPATQQERLPMDPAEKRLLLEKIKNGEECNPFPDVLDKLKRLNLTIAGKCEMSEFPVEALEYALQLYNKAVGLLLPYAFVRKQALIYCDRQKISPDWRWKKDLLQAYNIEKDAPRYERMLPPQRQHTSSSTGGTPPLSRMTKIEGSQKRETSSYDEKSIAPGHSHGLRIIPGNLTEIVSLATLKKAYSPSLVGGILAKMPPAAQEELRTYMQQQQKHLLDKIMNTNTTEDQRSEYIQQHQNYTNELLCLEEALLNPAGNPPMIVPGNVVVLLDGARRSCDEDLDIANDANEDFI